MNYRRIVIAALAATVVYYVYGFLVEGLLIRKDFSPYSAVYRSADTVMGYMPLGFACTLIATFVIAIINAKATKADPAPRKASDSVCWSEFSCYVRSWGPTT